MITVKGSLKLRSSFEVEIDMTEEEFDALERWQQEDVISGEISWSDWLDSADVDDLDVDDIE